MTIKERESSKRRSARLLEDEELWRARPPILNDVKELNAVLSVLAERHFVGDIALQGYGASGMGTGILGASGSTWGVREEVDTLAAFMCTVEKHKSAAALNGGRCT